MASFCVLAMAAISYSVLPMGDRRPQLPQFHARRRGRQYLKGKLSIAGYVVAIPLALVSPWIAVALNIAIAPCGSCPIGASARGRLLASHNPPQLPRLGVGEATMREHEILLTGREETDRLGSVTF
jgi:hypothetical protein